MRLLGGVSGVGGLMGGAEKRRHGLGNHLCRFF